MRRRYIASILCFMMVILYAISAYAEGSSAGLDVSIATSSNAQRNNIASDSNADKEVGVGLFDECRTLKELYKELKRVKNKDDISEDDIHEIYSLAIEMNDSDSDLKASSSEVSYIYKIIELLSKLDNSPELLEVPSNDIGKIAITKKNSKVYTYFDGGDSYKTGSNFYEIEIEDHFMHDGVEWYEFSSEYIDEYTYIKAKDVSFDREVELEYTECTCGNFENNKLELHADSCARKVFSKSTAEDNSAKTIAHMWSELPEDIQEFILTYLGWIDQSKLEQLKSLVGINVDKTVVTDGIYIKTSGNIPETAELKVDSIIKENYSNNIMEYITNLNDIVFALDIRLVNNNEKWQPSYNESITVTLDVKSFGLEDGDKIGIIHETEEGILEDLGKYEVVNGEITFKTTGFSVFYGYTVDFEYAGVWYSINGGSGIYLSDLLKALKINKDVNDIEDITFSNPSLIEIELIEFEGGGIDYWLRSLESFATKEFLVIYFNNGEEIVINTYDAVTETINSGTYYWTGSKRNNYNIDGTAVINLTGNVTLAGTITVKDGAKLIINGNGNSIKAVTANSLLRTNMFDVRGDGQLIINDTIVDGGAIWSGSTDTSVDRGTRNTGLSVRLITTLGNNDDNRATVILDNSTLKNGQSSSGAAILLRDADCILRNKSKVLNCSNTGNSGVFHLQGGYTQNLTIDDCHIKGNNSLGTYGGTIRTNASSIATIDIIDTVFEYNYSVRNGGVILYNVSTAGPDEDDNHCIFRNCILRYNSSGERGGAIQCESYMELYDTHIHNNYAPNHGGGIVLLPYTLDAEGANPTVKLGDGCIIEKNRASNGGGIAVLVKANAEGNIRQYQVDLVVDLGENGYIKNNVADDSIIQVGTVGAGTGIELPNTKGCGGGVFIETMNRQYTTNLRLEQGTISENKAVDGAGIYVKDTDVHFGQIYVLENEASNNGGGLYIIQEDTSDKGTTTIASGDVVDNKAKGFGGGIYQYGAQGECFVSGDGSIRGNEAANGGGIYLAYGSRLNISGGLIYDNKAKGTPGVNTAKADGATKGVGGGIYVGNGISSTIKTIFNMNAEDGTQVGLYGNNADFAASDVYTSGHNTALTLPDATNMPLKGSVYEKVDNWYTDFCELDSNYPLSTLDNQDNPGRYKYDLRNKVAIDTSKLQSTDTYYCMTLGTGFVGDGNITIIKRITTPAVEDENFVFYVQGTDDGSTFNMRVDIVVKAGKTSGSATVSHIPDGNYKVTEDETWNHQYQLASDTINPQAVIIGEAQEDWDISFKNMRKASDEDNSWFNGNAWCKNIFDGTSNANGFGVEIKDIVNTIGAE